MNDAFDGSNERATVERACRGDPAALAWIRGRYASAVHALFLADMPPEAAQERTTALFDRLADDIEHVGHGDHLGAWLLERARAQAAGAPRATAGGDEVLTAVRSLPDVFRIPLLLRFVGGLEGEAIAEATGNEAATTRTALAKGLGLLADRLGWPPPQGLDEGYLWDGTGRGGGAALRLESALVAYAYTPPRHHKWKGPALLALVVLVVALAAWWASRPNEGPAGWRVAWLEGPRGATTLAVGGEIRTTSEGRVRIAAPDGLTLDLEPDSVLRLEADGAEGRRVVFARGAIEVRMGRTGFVLRAPSADVTAAGAGDWTVETKPDGEGLVHVEEGRVRVTGRPAPDGEGKASALVPA
ncbi:MAG: FecR domain-containing protein, partial [Planctomycetota bacterium]